MSTQYCPRPHHFLMMLLLCPVGPDMRMPLRVFYGWQPMIWLPFTSFWSLPPLARRSLQPYHASFENACISSVHPDCPINLLLSFMKIQRADCKIVTKFYFTFRDCFRTEERLLLPIYICFCAKSESCRLLNYLSLFKAGISISPSQSGYFAVSSVCMFLLLPRRNRELPVRETLGRI